MNQQICFRNRLLLVIALVIQNSISTLVGKVTRSTTPSSSPDDLYSINHFLVTAELSKFMLSILLELTTNGHFVQGLIDNIRLHIIQNPIDAIKGSLVPAFLYFLSNTMQYVALTNLTAPVFQVVYQSKLVTTAIVSVVLLNRTYSTQQWISLVIISAGVAIVVIDAEGSMNKEMHHAVQQLQGNSTQGYFAVSTSCIISAFAGVYFEKVLKGEGSNSNQQEKKNRPPPSLWLRNSMLAFFSIIVALSQSLWHDTSLRSKGTYVERPFLHGFTPLVWVQVSLLSFGGLIVAAVMKYTDNMIKGLATGISVLVSSGLSAVLLGTTLSVTFALGAGMICFAIMIYLGSCPLPIELPLVQSRLKRYRTLVFLVLLSLSLSQHGRILVPLNSYITAPNSILPDFATRVDEAHPDQNYSMFILYLYADGIMSLNTSAFRIAKPLDLEVAGLELPKSFPLRVDAEGERTKVPEAGSDGLDFDTFHDTLQYTKDLLSLSDSLFCPEGRAPGTRIGVRVISNMGATLAPDLVAYLERAPKRDPTRKHVTCYVQSGVNEFSGFAIEEVEETMEDGLTVNVSVATVVVLGKTPSLKRVVAGIELSVEGLVASAKGRALEKAADEKVE